MDIDKLLRTCKTLEIEHDGWPVIKTRNVENMCKIIKEIIPSLDLLQTRLELGCKIEHQDGRWYLFESGGDSVCSGKSIRELLVNLIFTDC